MPPRQSSNDGTRFESNWRQINDKFTFFMFVFENKMTPCPSFDGMGLDENVLKGIYAYGLEKPSPVQQRAIMPILSGHDVIMQAQSGTGKTAAFVVGILQKLDVSINLPQALIIAPTRELVQQIQKVVLEIGKYKHVKCYSCIGGRKAAKDIKALSNGVHVVVGTPGRLIDMMKRGALTTDTIKIVCLDEADEMLKGMFKIEILKVYENLKRASFQVVLLSATFPDAFHKLTKTIIKSNPVKILVKKGQLTLEGIEQFFILMEKEAWKLETLCDLYTSETFTHPTVVFCNTRERVDKLSLALEERLLAATTTHGKRIQKERENKLRDFRTGASRILVTTDMLARGIDVQQIAVVINYDLPEKKEIYMHRIGRSGRFGRKGIAINFITKKDIGRIREIEEYYNTQVEEMPVDISVLLRRISLSD